MALEPVDIGARQTLDVVAVEPNGVALGPHHIWLSRSELEEGAEPEVGQSFTVFVASNREGEPVATFQTPYAEAGEFAYLEVVDIVEHGAYLDWGLSRDLFLPNFLQYDTPRVGKKLMVAIDVDERGRLFGSNRLVDYFDPDLSELKPRQKVALRVYGRNERGWLVIVEGTYAGMLYSNQVFRPLSIGDELTGWIQTLRDDGKVDCSLQPVGRKALDNAREQLWAVLTENEGFLPLTDRSPPDEIRATLQMSKKAFKKALGGLYKEGKVQMAEGGIRATPTE